MPRQVDSIVWQHVTIPREVSRCVTKFLYDAEYPPAYPDATVGAKWETLKRAYYAMPEDVRMTLPELPWPEYVTEEMLQRARTVVLLYRHATPAERKPLLEGLMVEPRDDVALFGIAATGGAARTPDLGAPAVPLGPPPPRKSETRRKPTAPAKPAKSKRSK